jgi:hypothetical protein
MTASGGGASGPHLPPGGRISPEGRLVYCTDPAHRDGEHDASCLPPADPANPELRLLRAIHGLCGRCDRTDEHDHDEDRPHRAARRHRTMASSPGQNAERKAADRDRGRQARIRLSGQIAQMQADRKAQDAQGGNDDDDD